MNTQHSSQALSDILLGTGTLIHESLTKRILCVRVISFGADKIGPPQEKILWRVPGYLPHLKECSE